MASQALEGYEESASEGDEAYGGQAQRGPTYVEEQQQLRQAFLQVPASPLHSFDKRYPCDACEMSLVSLCNRISHVLHLVYRCGWLWQYVCMSTPMGAVKNCAAAGASGAPEAMLSYSNLQTDTQWRWVSMQYMLAGSGEGRRRARRRPGRLRGCAQAEEACCRCRRAPITGCR